jgi:hypothetical protein
VQHKSSNKNKFQVAYLMDNHSLHSITILYILSPINTLLNSMSIMLSQAKVFEYAAITSSSRQNFVFEI